MKTKLLGFLLIVFLTISGLFIYSRAFTLVTPYNKIHTTPIIIEHNNSVGQSFVSKNKNIYRVAVLVATYNQSISETFNFKLKEVNSLDWIYEIDNTTVDLFDNSYLYFDFPIIEESKGKEFYFEITLLDDKDDEKIAYWISKDNSYNEGALYINNKIISDGDLTFQLQSNQKIVKQVYDDLTVHISQQKGFFIFYFFTILFVVVLLIKELRKLYILRIGYKNEDQ